MLNKIGLKLAYACELSFDLTLCIPASFGRADEYMYHLLKQIIKKVASTAFNTSHLSFYDRLKIKHRSLKFKQVHAH